MTSPTLGFLIFPVTYVLFRLDYSPLALSWTSLAVYAILGLVQKPWLIMKMVDYKWSEIWGVYRSCIIVTVVSLPIPLVVYRLLDTTNLLHFIVIGVVCVLSVALSVFFLGINSEMRKKVLRLTQRPHHR